MRRDLPLRRTKPAEGYTASSPGATRSPSWRVTCRAPRPRWIADVAAGEGELGAWSVRAVHHAVVCIRTRAIRQHRSLTLGWRPAMVTTSANSDLRDYAARWQSLVHAWVESDDEERTALVRRALESGLTWLPKHDGAPPEKWARVACETAVLRAADLVDAFGYFWHNPDLPWYLCGHDEEVQHFAAVGWKELRNPHPGLRPVVLLEPLPRPHERGRQPGRPLPRRGTAPRATPPCPR